MDFSLYKPTELERMITGEYLSNGVYSPVDMDIQHIASIFNVDLEYYNGRPFSRWGTGYAVIFLSIDDDEETKREVFFHELCHLLRHCGDQRDMPELFRTLQEAQASHFQLYAAMPYYLLQDPKEFHYKMEYIMYLTHEFIVPFDTAKTRFEQIERRLFQASLDRPSKDSIYYKGGWYRFY